MPHLRLHAQTYCLFVAALAPVLLAPVLATAGHAAGPPQAVAAVAAVATATVAGRIKAAAASAEVTRAIARGAAAETPAFAMLPRA